MDTKRISGPEKTLPYQLYSELVKKKIQIDKRLDSREYNEIRKIYIKTNVVSKAKGSAYIECGNTKVIVSVFDPREIPNRNEYSLQGELYCEFKFAPFSCGIRKSPQPSAQEKEYSSLLKRALESAVCRSEFPNFQVDIFAIVLQNDGSALSTAISAAGIALAQAGVPMYDLVACLTIGLHGEQIFVDPTIEEEELCATQSDIPILTYNDLTLMLFNELSDDSDWESDCEDKKTKINDKQIKKASNDAEEINKKIEIDKKPIEHGILMLSMLQHQQQITEFYQYGSMSLETLKKLTNILIDKNNEIIPVLQDSLIKCIEKSLKSEHKAEI